MVGLDTNILVRFLTQDDALLSPIANEILEERLTEDAPGFISLVAFTETAWVLRRGYRYSFREIADALEGLLQAAEIRVESEREALLAIERSRNEGVEISDVLAAALGQKAGCSVTLTFDKRAARLPGFELAT